MGTTKTPASTCTGLVVFENTEDHVYNGRLPLVRYETEEQIREYYHRSPEQCQINHRIKT